MPLTKTKHKAKKQTRKNNSIESRFEREWMRVLKLQQQNETFTEEIEQLTQRVFKEIQKEEERLCQALHVQTLRFIDFMGRKSIARWQRVELFEWTHENLQKLTSNPFSSCVDIQLIAERFQPIAEQYFDYDDEPEEYIDFAETDPQSDVDNKKTKDTPEPEQDKDTSQPDMFEDLFSDFEHTATEEDEGPTETDDLLGDEYWDDIDDDSFEESPDEKEAKALNALMKTSSITSLFRRLAKVLHPDKEQDPEIKEKKHALMSELIEARDNNNIFKMFNLYKEHIGESPLHAITDDAETVITLLKAQVNRLRQEREENIYKNPAHAHVYTHFYAKTQPAIKRKINAYKKDINEYSKELSKLTMNLRSIKALVPYLQARYESSMFTQLDDFVFFDPDD